jgi:hypothetical protein
MLRRLRMSRLITAGLASVLVASSALGADTSAPTSAGANKPAKLEQVPGSDLKRVILTPKAAERLAIQTAPVREEPVMRWLTVAAEVEVMTSDQTAFASVTQGPTGTPTATDAPPLRVTVPRPDSLDKMIGQVIPMLSLASKDDDDDDDDDDKHDVTGSIDDAVNDNKDTPPVVFVMPTNGIQGAKRLRAKLIEPAPSTDAGAAPQAHYLVDVSGQHRLRPGQRVNVRIPQPGSGTPQKVIPHSAVIYDTQGNAWTYVTPEPLTFIRHPINVEYVQGDTAVLKEGPAVGTLVVTAGAAELLGVEQKFGH